MEFQIPLEKSKMNTKNQCVIFALCFVKVCDSLFMILGSVVTTHFLRRRRIFIKRDDLLDVAGISGNKVRKVKFMMERVDSSSTSMISYGGSQSNAMTSLAIVSNKLYKDFVYLTRKLPSLLSTNIKGNLKTAIDNGAKVCYFVYNLHNID